MKKKPFTKENFPNIWEQTFKKKLILSKELRDSTGILKELII